MELRINEQISEFHFMGTFIFPDDLDFLGEMTKVQYFVDCFNNMIQNRLGERENKCKVNGCFSKENLKMVFVISV